MIYRRFVRGALVAFLVLVVACVTVNIYFPAAEVQKAADEIVEEVRPEAAPPSKPAPGESQSLRENIMTCLASFWVAPAEAAMEIDISSPAIRSLRASLKDRFKALKPSYDKGLIGENNRGYLTIRDMGGLNLRQKAQIKKLVDAENDDRKALYEEIIRANKLDSSVLPDVERTFAKEWQEKATSRGWWIQKGDGSWIKR